MERILEAVYNLTARPVANYAAIEVAGALRMTIDLLRLDLRPRRVVTEFEDELETGMMAAIREVDLSQVLINLGKQ